MTQERSGGSLSVEIRDRYTQEQQTEIYYYAQSIIEGLGGNSEDEKEQERVAKIAFDCITRGLSLRGRVGLMPGESVANIFETGYEKREEIVNNLKSHAGNAIGELLLSSEELEGINQADGLAEDFRPIDRLYYSVNEKRRVIDKFHQEVFDRHTVFASQTQLLKGHLKKEYAFPFEEDLNARIYANFLVRLILYPGERKPSLFIEPKDIAALADLWSDKAIKLKSQQVVVDRVIKASRGLALSNNLSLSDQAIAGYTWGIFERVSSDTLDKVTLESLNSGIYAFLPEDLAKEADEFINKDDLSILVSKKEIDAAKANNERIFSAQADYLRIIDISEDDLDADFGKEHQEKIVSISALELVFLLDKIAEDKLEDKGDKKIRLATSLEEDINDLVPLKTFTNAASMAYSPALKEEETGNKVLDFSKEDIIKRVVNKIEERILTALSTQGVKVEEIIDDLPSSLVATILARTPFDTLDAKAKEKISALDTNKLFNILLELGVSVDPLEDSLVTSADSTFLEGYLKILPLEVKQALVGKLTHTISF